MNIENPETVEIHGLKTIHKLCKFGADNNMEGCTFTDIVERMFLELKKLEGCVVVNTESLLLHAQSIRMFNDGDMENHYEEIEEHVCAIEEMVEAARGGNE